MGLFGSKKKSEEVMRSGEAILSDGTAIGVARQVELPRDVLPAAPAHDQESCRRDRQRRSHRGAGRQSVLCRSFAADVR